MTVKPTAVNKWDIIPETSADDFLVDAFLKDWMMNAGEMCIRSTDGRVLRLTNRDMALLPAPDIGQKIRDVFDN